jgi:serine-type D-Ala-D-Ala carboxypeptidase (penicillin-binding protein 5/6)
MRWRVGLGLLVIVAAASAFNYLRPIPAVAATHNLPTSDLVPGTAPSLPWPSAGSAAVGVSGLGLIGSSGNEQALPAASVTKVMTALVVLVDKPLTKGQGGPTITLSDVDVQSYESDLADKQSTVRVEAGEQLTELQLLQGMLIPSANNLAETVARWDAGSIDRFVGKMNDQAKVLHMTRTRFADPSGASDGSVSTPTDLIRLGMQAMQNPVFASIVAMPQAEMPVAGTVYNVDAVLGQSGIVGIKTGSGLNAGANFLFASSLTVDNHTILLYGCVMGQPTLEISFNAAKALIAAMAPAVHVRRVIARNQLIGNYTTPWGDSTDIVSTVDVDLAEWPGMILREHLGAGALAVDHPLAPGTFVGNEHVVLGDYELDVPLVTADPMYPPGRLWRLTRISF